MGFVPGTKLLCGANGICHGAIKPQTYLLSIENGKRFLLWRRDIARQSGAPGIYIDLFNSDSLAAITEMDHAATAFAKVTEESWHFNSRPESSLLIQAYPFEEFRTFPFPEEWVEIGDFCAVTEIPGIYGETSKADWWKTVIVLISPKRSCVWMFPQDWFNKADMDVGYQWITSAYLDEETETIRGQGIRIDNFELDETNKQKAR
jgi:hypothetical protein